MITSLTNKRVKELVALKTSKGRKLSGQFIVEGRHLVLEAKKLNLAVEIYTTDEKLEGELVSTEVMKKICSTDSIVNQIAVCNKLEKKDCNSQGSQKYTDTKLFY